MGRQSEPTVIAREAEVPESSGKHSLSLSQTRHPGLNKSPLVLKLLSLTIPNAQHSQMPNKSHKSYFGHRPRTWTVPKDYN